MLWNHWWKLVCELRSACARTRTFLWMAICLAGMTTRKDLMGVTSIVRAGRDPTISVLGYNQTLALEKGASGTHPTGWT